MDKRHGLRRRSSKVSANRDAKSDSSPAIQTGDSKGSIEELALQKISQDGGMALSKLVDEIERDLGYSRDRIVRRIIEMRDTKKIRMQEREPYASIGSYFFSPTSLWFWAAALATVVSFMLIFFSSGYLLYLRYVFGGLLVLFLPGYALIELLYPKKQELNELIRFALSIGLSLAIVPLVGLVLNYTPFGITLYPIAGSLVFITLAFLVGGVNRKYGYYKLLRDIS